MSKQRLLTVAVVALLLLNAVTLFIHFTHRPGHGPRGGPKQLIIERLKFDDGQVRAYEELIAKHRKRIGELDARMMELRERLYTTDDTRIADSLIVLVGATQSEVEYVHTSHFADIRALCRPEQQPLFAELTKDLASYFRMGPPPPERR